MNAHDQMMSRIEKHGRQLLAIFPNATEQDPVKLCKKLRRLEAEAAKIGLRMCNGPEYGSEEEIEAAKAAVLSKVRRLLVEYQPKTGAKCSCQRGVQRDNCPACEGTGMVIDFRAIRARKATPPIFVNCDPRGYALKIPNEYVRGHELDIHKDWGGYGIIAPDLTEGG